MGMTLKQKILILDDEARNLNNYFRILRTLDIEIFKTTSAQEALILSKEHLFALIITDIMMPEINGFEFVEKLKETKLNQTTPVIFITGNRFDDEDIFKGYELGAADYLMKPFSNYILKSKVSVFVQLAQKKAELQNALEEVQTLKGFLPICSYCHNIRDDKGYWEKIDKYIADHSNVQFSHGMCPTCMKKEFPDIYEEMVKDGDIKEVK